MIDWPTIKRLEFVYSISNENLAIQVKKKEVNINDIQYYVGGNEN